MPINYNKFGCDYRRNSIVDIRQCRYGDMLALSSDRVISRSLDLYGEWSEHEIDRLAKFVGDGTIALDVGANIGTHCLAFAKRRPLATIIGFEPRPLVNSIAEINCYRNGARNARVVPMACGEEGGLVSISLPGKDEYNVGSYRISAEPLVNNSDNLNYLDEIDISEILVRMIKLDSIDFRRKVSLIKIDVEGMEREVIKGALSLIKLHRPCVFFETLTVDNLDILFGIFSSIKYKLYWMETHQFNLSNYRNNPNNIWDRTEMGIIAVSSDIDFEMDFEEILEVPTSIIHKENPKQGYKVKYLE